MVYYIRFLKPPRITAKGQGPKNNLVKAVITVTTDLGDSFCCEPLDINCQLLQSCKSEQKLIQNVRLKWQPGFHALPLEYLGVDEQSKYVVKADVECPLEEPGLPAFVSVQSDEFSASQGTNGTRHVLRTIPLLTLQEPLQVWEETGESIARHIWDAGLALVLFMGRLHSLQGSSHFSNTDRHCLRILELGSGTGLAGLAFASLSRQVGASVILTDLPAAQDLLQLNARAARSRLAVAGDQACDIRVAELDWDDERDLRDILDVKDEKNPGVDLVLVSDCTYNCDSVAGLVKMMARVRALNARRFKEVWVAMKMRHASEDVFFKEMASAGFVEQAHKTVALPELGREFEYSDVVDIYSFVDRERFKERGPFLPF